MRAAKRPPAEVTAEANRSLALLVPLGEGAAEQVDAVRASLRGR